MTHTLLFKLTFLIMYTSNHGTFLTGWYD